MALVCFAQRHLSSSATGGCIFYNKGGVHTTCSSRFPSKVGDPALPRCPRRAPSGRRASARSNIVFINTLKMCVLRFGWRGDCRRCAWPLGRCGGPLGVGHHVPSRFVWPGLQGPVRDPWCTRHLRTLPMMYFKSHCSWVGHVLWGAPEEAGGDGRLTGALRF